MAVLHSPYRSHRLVVEGKEFVFEDHYCRVDDPEDLQLILDRFGGIVQIAAFDGPEPIAPDGEGESTGVEAAEAVDEATHHPSLVADSVQVDDA